VAIALPPPRPSGSRQKSLRQKFFNPSHLQESKDLVQSSHKFVTVAKDPESKPWDAVASLTEDSKNSTLFVFISAVAGKVITPIHKLIVGYEIDVDHELTFARIDPTLQTAMLEALVFINECCERYGYQTLKSVIDIVNKTDHELYFYYIILTAGYFEMNSFNDLRRPLSIRHETMTRIRMINTKERVMDVIRILARDRRRGSGCFQPKYYNYT